jgi:hypothetical protein
VLKAILRHMRRVYLEDFNHRTQFIKAKRYASPQYFIDCLNNYVLERFSSTTAAQPSFDSISFFLGSIFYPKIMKLFYDKPSTCSTIDKLHKSLYSYSTYRLKELNSTDVYRFIFTNFCTNYKDDLLEKNKTIQKEKEDYIKAFDYLIKLCNM